MAMSVRPRDSNDGGTELPADCYGVVAARCLLGQQ